MKSKLQKREEASVRQAAYSLKSYDEKIKTAGKKELKKLEEKKKCQEDLTT